MTGIREFVFAPTPHLHFGGGKISVLPGIARAFGRRTLLITGAKSFRSSSWGQTILQTLGDAGMLVEQYSFEGEPSPAVVDLAVERFSEHPPDCVVAIGGGSALDAGKAISAMLPLKHPVRDYLEGVGTKMHPGVKVPFIAVPTTAGTGSEATKNAVLSQTGQAGFKRSLRHQNFVPDVAIVDPLLTITCSRETTAASGMDAFTQLLESWVSTAANPITDALALDGLRHICRALPNAYKDGTDAEARTAMALASFLSGVTLANAGLGVVHGIASSVGAFFHIPHGVICSALMAPANSITIRKLRKGSSGEQALEKYAAAGRIFANSCDRTDAYYVDFLLDTIHHWTEDMNIPRLSHYGVTSADFDRIIKASENKNNPVALSYEEMTELLTVCI